MNEVRYVPPPGPSEAERQLAALLQAFEECRTLIREMHETNQTLRDTIKEAKEWHTLIRDAVEKEVYKEVEDVMDRRIADSLERLHNDIGQVITEAAHELVVDMRRNFTRMAHAIDKLELLKHEREALNRELYSRYFPRWMDK
jgi:chaperonin cofactor prefoldin